MKKILFISFLLLACSSESRLPASAGSYPIEVVGGDEASFTPAAPGEAPEELGKDFDVLVVGGGLSGLSSAIFLADAKKNVLLLEKEAGFGGLAQGTNFPGTNMRFDRGGAYWTSSYPEELEILKRIGLGDYENKHAIPEPIDSYLWNGELFAGIWEKETLERLPASFALFQNELRVANKEELIPNQPIEDSKHLELDRVSAAEWIRSMPAGAARRTDPESKAIYARFVKEKTAKKLDRRDPMKGVIGLMDLYCRSALGTTAAYVSGVAFANFYISEIETRYTTAIGTAQASENMVKQLEGRPNVKLQASSTVTRIRNFPQYVETTFVQGGKAFLVRSRYLVFAGQLKFAPRIIEGLIHDAPEQAKLMSNLGYANYSVHAVEVKGHPYRASYDTWTRSGDASSDDFTDVILGRWMDPALSGYEGYRDFATDPPGNSILTIYHPLSLPPTGAGYTDQAARKTAARAVERMLELYNPFLAKMWQTKIDVLAVQTSRWPYSVHVAGPGHFLNKAKILRRPYRRIFFANNNLGTPAFEEALFRGHCAANNILLKLDPGFHQEDWSQCPVDP